MASSTSFRGRRVIDPVLIQRGSLPKDSKQRSSFSDLAAAWENVGEAKSALEAAEARINEANAGLGPELEEEERPDLPLQEIFSETQRYGRVTRYELRPNSYGRAVPLAPRLVGEERPPRRMIDYPLNAERQQLRARAPGHPLLSPPSRDIHGTSSLNSVITNNSDALARLKERIKQQKEQASRSSPESVQGNRSPRNDDPFATAPIIPPRADLDVPTRNVISVRKVASAPAAPAYKGFSEVESKTTALSEVNRKVQSKGPDNHRVKRGNQRPPKPKKVPPKVLRVLAPRRPADIITTSSWRAGQQTVKRILGPVKKKKTSPPRSRPHSSSSQDTDVSEVKGLNMEWKADDSSKEDDDRGDNDSSGGSSRRSEAERERAKSPPGSDHVEDLDKQDKDLDAEPAKLLSGARVEDSTADQNVKELKGSKMISTEARNILSDLELDSDESDDDVKQTVPEPRPKLSLAKKSSKKRKAPGPEKKEIMYPTQKVRHYDADEVKKYMAKQMADRKKRLKEDRLHKEKALEERKKKLEELYNKQKKNLRNNLTHRDKNTMGETYLKGHGDLRSIIYPYSRPFPRDDVECYSEDAGVSESDKENLDIASFRGLPIHSTSKAKYRNSDDLDRDSTASSPLETSRDFNMSPDHEMEVERGKSNQVPCVTSVTVGTRMADNRPSAYVGFPEESFGSDQERPRDDIPTTRSNLHPRSGSPDRALLDRERGGNRSPTGVGRVKPLSPPRDNRIASIKLTAAQLQHRLESEARRLGINLQATALGEMDDHLPTSAPASDHTVFNGALPGVGNLHEQADLNQELDTMTSAATTIQAAYRGHSVRQGLNWRLPSGQTLRSTVRQAVYQKPASSGAGLSESSQYSTARDTVVSNAERSISEAGTLYSSSSSLIQPSMHSSLKVDKPPTVGGSSMHETERRFDSRGHLPGYSKGAKPSSLPWRSSGGDSMSVINIFARKNPHLRLTRPEDESLNERGSETASLLDETAQGNIGANDTASLLEPVADLNQSEELLEQTLVAGSPDRSKEQHEYEDDYTGSSTLGSEENQHEESGKQRSPSRDKNVDESAVYSESFVSPETSRTEHKTKSPNETLQSGPLSPTLSEGDLSHVSDTAERSRALSPVRHSPTKEREVPGTSHQFSPPAPVRLPPPVFMPRSEAGSRISPGSLDMRLTAELNRLEYMEESVRQITDVERTRSVSLAQQETVSLAQILKSKQLTHAREMENLRAKAREEALESAKQLEEARRAAADAAAGAAETIARMRLETAAVISDSADHLVKVQTEAARTTAESAKHVEEARTSAARTLLEAAQQQAADTRGVAAEAASAAAEAAVKSTMTRFHEQQEQILKEREALMKSYRHGARDERPRDSYASYTSGDRTDSYSRSRTSRLGTDTLDRSRKSPGTGTYTSDDFESSRGSHREKDTSIQTASNLSIDRSASHSRRTPTLSVPASRSRHDSPTGERTGSIPEMMEQSLADSVVSDIGLDVAEDQSLIEALTDDKAKKDPRDLSLAGEADYTLNFEESVISSHTATDDEIDYRMILPSESHRRRSLGKAGRSGSIGSDQGTVSYSSDDNHESQELRAEKTLEEISAAPFSAEDSFSQFTSEMVRLMKEEEVRAKHQEGLLRLREKALKEKTRAEMAWLELQKQRHRDKGADDVMPSIRKRQRGVLMRLQAEQAEIKRLKAANRAASYERRLLLMQQEEIAQLRKTTKRIRETANTERTAHGEDGETLKPGEHVEVELPKSEADSTGVPEELEDKPADQSTRSRSAISEDIKAASPNTSASVAEELPEASRTESFPSHGSRESGAGERKRTLSEGESDDGSAMESTHSAAKGSPTASDATVMQKLKKLRSQSSERYLTQREQKLMKRRKEAENLLENKKKLLEWERRLDKEESLVKNLLNEALSLERSKGRATSITSEDDEQKDRSGRVSASPSVSKSSSKAGEKDRSAQRTPSISESIKPSESRGHERSASESSVPEDITISARDRSRDTEKSADSSIPEVEMKTRSQGSSIPEEIPEEYVNDTFESVDSTVVTPTHSTPVRSDLSFKRDASPTVSRRSSKDEGSKSEEEASMTETSDYNSDIESRVRRLKDQLELRKREVKRLYNERKRQRKAMLRAQEASLRKELQAVEMVISRTKAELNRPQAESNRTDSNSNSVEQRPTPTKSESSDTTREVRYNLSRTSDAGGSRKISPPDKAVTVSSRNESAGGRAPSVVNVEETASGVSSLREERSVLAEGSRNSVGSLSAGLRQPSDSERSEHKSSVRELNDLKGDVEEEAMTAEDLSFSEGGKIQSKASLAEKSIEERSRSLGESLSGSHRQLSGSHRQPSGSVPTSLSQERQDSEVDIDSEVKTAVDLSLSEGSEVQTRSKPSFSETSIRENVRKSVPDATDGLEESIHSRSGKSTRTSESKPILPESFRESRPSLPEKSHSVRTDYSSSFESAHSEEEEKTEADISEHISIEEDAKESDVSEVIDSVKDSQERENTAVEQEKGRDVENTQEASEISEEIFTDEKEKSDIEDDLPSTRKTVSISGGERAEMSRDEGSNLLKPAENEEQLPSYSADFEPSGLDEEDREEKSDNLTPPVSYTPEFEASESNIAEEHENSEELRGQHESSSVHLKELEHSGSDGEHVKERSRSEQLRDSSSFSREKLQHTAQVAEQVTDEESIAEDISENVQDLEELETERDRETEETAWPVGFRKETEEGVLYEGKNDSKRGEMSPIVLPTTDVTRSTADVNRSTTDDNRSTTDVNRSTTDLTREQPEKKSVVETVERITDDLSAMLLKESTNCVTMMFEKRRRTTEVVPEDVANTPEKSRSDKMKAFVPGVEDTFSMKEDEYTIPESPKDDVSEAEDISEHVGYSDGEDSVSGLDFGTEKQEEDELVSQTGQVRRSRDAQGDSIVGKLSDALLKEAASQMIAIMRSRQEKLAALPSGQSSPSHPSHAETKASEPHSGGEESPLVSPRSSRFMAVQRFPEGLPKYAEETSPPPGSPTKEETMVIDEKELADKLDQLRRLHEHLDGARDNRDDDEEDDRLEFNVISNSIIEFPSQDEEEEDEGFRRSRGSSFLFSVPHRPNDVSSLVGSSLSVIFDRKKAGLPLDNVTPPPEIIGDSEPGDDLEANSKRVYRRLVFDLSGNVLKELLTEEAPSHRPSWMKVKRRRKRRFYRSLEPLIDESDYLPVVEQQVLNLIGLGEARPSLESVRRKTPLKAGKKDLVDAILIQELREDEPLWIDYDDDELAVKFQVADAIFESLLSETVMVMNAVQLRREARMDALRS